MVLIAVAEVVIIIAVVDVVIYAEVGGGGVVVDAIIAVGLLEVNKNVLSLFE